MTATKLDELAGLLVSSYQERIKQLGNLSGFNTAVIIEIAKQLLEIAEQYHCYRLTVWANDLKTQAKLFDIKSLARTLKGFELLLTQLREGSC